MTIFCCLLTQLRIYTSFNKINPSIQLTINHTSIENKLPEDSCDCEKKLSFPFLDTKLSIIKGRIGVDLYRKYLHKSESVPTSKQLPQQDDHSFNTLLTQLENRENLYNPSNRENRFSELKKLLLERGYNERKIDSSIQQARLVPREAALKKVKRK